MSSSSEGCSLYLRHVYQIKYDKAKYLQSVLNNVKDKQIRDVEIAWDKYAGKDRNVGGEILYIWRFKNGENTDYEAEHFPVYLRESNEKDVIKWKNTFHSRTSNCIFISCRTTGILLFPQQNLQKILFPHELFSCINFYNIALMVFFLLQLYRQCWVNWMCCLSVTAQQLRLLYAHSPSFFRFKFIFKKAFPLKIYVASYHTSALSIFMHWMACEKFLMQVCR